MDCLRSRYYNPEIGRFLNADKYTGSTGTVLQHNIFCYCKNAAIIKCDPDGCYDKIATDVISYLKGILLANI